MPKRYLTKSLFTHALDCPTKLYYKLHSNEYVCAQDEDPFLAALAEGGIQVGEMAKLLFPGGVEPANTRIKPDMIAETKALLHQPEITIYEAAIAHERTFALVDILVRRGNQIDLIEVKSKSWPPSERDSVLKKNGKIRRGWQKYYYDLAFQVWVMQKALGVMGGEGFSINPYLLLIDKTKAASIDGLHPYFKVTQDENGRSKVVLTEAAAEIDLGDPIMTLVPAHREVSMILGDDDGRHAGGQLGGHTGGHPADHATGQVGVYTADHREGRPTRRAPRAARDEATDLEKRGFDAWVAELCRLIEHDEKYPVQIGAKCRNCEHRIAMAKLQELNREASHQPEHLSNDPSAPHPNDVRNPRELSHQPEKKAGFHECWREALGWTDEDFLKPHAFDVWHAKAQKLMDANMYRMEDITAEFLGVDDVNAGGVDNVDVGGTGGIGGMDATNHNSTGLYTMRAWEPGQKYRQAVQVMKMTGRHSAEEVVLSGLFEKMEGWTFPLYFIDFEAVAAAIPFYKGCRPYERVPFQFSVHVVHGDGRVEHAAEWIERRRGVYPGFDFVRKLKEALGRGDGVQTGSVFMYSHYEKTVLKGVADRLLESDEPDRVELLAWIWTLIADQSPRKLIDLQKLVVKYYYSVQMGGSNSIKVVLPAILAESEFLREEYSRPYSGLSLKNVVLWREDVGDEDADDDAGGEGVVGEGVGTADRSLVDGPVRKVINPYQMLTEMGEMMEMGQMSEIGDMAEMHQDNASSFRGDARPHGDSHQTETQNRLGLPSEKDLELASPELRDAIEQGGDAMMAWARIQFDDVSDEDREQVIQSLLRYCELDTLAMVMIYQHWNSLK